MKNMKTVIFIIPFLLLTALSVFSQQLDSASGFSFGFIEDGSGNIEIWGYNGSNSEVQIPSSIGNISVTQIRQMAFMGSQLTNIVIPRSVRGIGALAFMNSHLTSVTIPDSINWIGYRVFMNARLTSIIIPGSVTTIGTEAFAGNPLTSISIGQNVSMVVDSFDNAFEAFYISNGKKAGTYTFADGKWSFK
jgi:hypothetical protein